MLNLASSKQWGHKGIFNNGDFSRNDLIIHRRASSSAGSLVHLVGVHLLRAILFAGLDGRFSEVLVST